MAKMAKKIQTDYTQGGHDISQTAIPYYQNALGYMNDYLSDPTAYIDKYLNQYYSDNAQSRKDFDRQYLNAMSKATANNYAATHGGYSSAGQRSYQDLQRSQNDLYARMREKGIQSAAGLAQDWYNSLLNASPVYQNAYNLGKDYSDIQQYNNAVQQNNAIGNQIAGALPTVGSAIGSIWGPVGSAIGGAAGGALGSALSVDTSGITGSSGGTTGSGSSQWSNLGNVITNASEIAEQKGGWSNILKPVWNKK